MMRLEKVETSEHDRIAYQENLLMTRINDAIFEHMKCLSRSPSLPTLLIIGEKRRTKMHEQVNMLISFSNQCFYLEKSSVHIT